MPSLLSWKRRAEGAKFENETFEKMDLRSMKAFGSSWIKCTFIECQFDLADFRTARLDLCTFRDCSFRLVNIATAFLEGSIFLSCDFEQASFAGSNFREVEFRNCRMAYGETMFQDATVMARLVFSKCNLHGSNLDFRYVATKSLVFDDSNLWGCKVSMGCAAWNGTMDEKTARQFLALVARVREDPRIAELAGDQMKVVARLMDERKS